jgi:hypothetical protein
MLTHPMLNIRILFTNYDIITDFLNLDFCLEHFISIKHRIQATFNINKKFNSDSLCAFKLVMQCRATIEEILDVTQQPIILFILLLANKTLIYNHIVLQTLKLIYTILCLFVFIFLCWQSCPYIIGITV